MDRGWRWGGGLGDLRLQFESNWFQPACNCLGKSVKHFDGDRTQYRKWGYFFLVGSFCVRRGYFARLTFPDCCSYFQAYLSYLHWVCIWQSSIRSCWINCHQNDLFCLGLWEYSAISSAIAFLIVIPDRFPSSDNSWTDCLRRCGEGRHWPAFVVLGCRYLLCGWEFSTVMSGLVFFIWKKGIRFLTEDASIHTGNMNIQSFMMLSSPRLRRRLCI